MPQTIARKDHLLAYLLILVFMGLLGLWLNGIDIDTGRQQAGVIIFSLGFVMLSAYVIAQIVKIAKLPLITGYIIAGILAGPYVSGFLTAEMVERLRLIDDLALSFIALMAGAELSLSSLKQRGKSIALNIVLISICVFSLVVLLLFYAGHHFTVISKLEPIYLLVFAILLGVICIARSPSSAIAIIDEVRADGPFTSTVLGVTILMDVLIIIFFTFAMAISRIIVTPGGVINIWVIVALVGEIFITFLIGTIIGKVISIYTERVGHDFLLFLLFIAFGVTRISLWLNDYMIVHFNMSLHLEPLLICMGAGFFVRNFSRVGPYFVDSLRRMALPIYALFFSLAGASLNFDSLAVCWPLALTLVLVRATGIFGGTWAAGKICHDPPVFNQNAWMSYLTQAGVAIGLAVLAARQFPEIGDHLNTVVLAIIAVNQIVGPITFKMALNNVGESGN
jgi:Kef-type K+ transport system membrane component KefB